MLRSEEHVVVSVIMGVYNGSRYLNDAVDSILNQTFSDFEFIIVNDASTDDTAEILSSYSDSRIKLITNESNLGLTKSLNKALNYAKGVFVARQDADDISHVERLSKQVKFLHDNPDIDMVGCQGLLIDINGIFIENINFKTDSNSIKSSILSGSQFMHGAVLIRKSVLNNVNGYREGFRYAQDYDLWLRLIENYCVSNLDEYLYYLRRLSNSSTTKHFDLQLALAYLAKAFFVERKEGGKDSYSNYDLADPERLLIEHYPDFTSEYFYKKFCYSIYLARQAYKSGEYRQEIAWLIRALKINSKNTTLAGFFLKVFAYRFEFIVSLYGKYIGWRISTCSRKVE